MIGIMRYMELKKVDMILARRKVIELYYKVDNITYVAHFFKMSRNTVKRILRRYREEGDKGLEDRSRRPHKIHRKVPEDIEDVIVEYRKKTGYGARRIERFLEVNYNFHLSHTTILKILRKHKLIKPFEKKSVIRTGRRYYNPLDYKPFTFFQVDLKEIVDEKTLPSNIYRTFLRLKKERRIPIYQFTAIDLRSRVRFISYSYEKSFSNGWNFIIYLILWLRYWGVRDDITIQTDWGEEFGGKSVRKIERLNRFLLRFGVKLTRIHKGRKEENGYVEKSIGRMMRSFTFLMGRR